MPTAQQAVHRQLGLTDEEYLRIEEILGREPNRAELAMYSVMWSEHCSYKSSRLHLKSLPSEAPQVLMGPGEGAGVIRVDDVAVAFRMESHNHPSFVEPFQGAATGIGGIVRDVLSVGARPIALLDPLRFGPLPSEGRTPDEAAARNRYLTEGVVSGISSYGNCIGVPTVGGEIKFEDTYSGNPLVNVMCIGVAPLERITRALAEGPGNAVILLGSSTGRDGIGGVSVLASATFDETAGEKRPSVQVGDPFTEKLLIEATLELLDRGLVVGVQDLGGAGLSCAASETAARAGTGMRLDLSRVPRREPGMDPFEVLISESQERMLVVVRPSDVEAALEVCRRWGLPASVIGEVEPGDRLEVFENGDAVAEVPAASLGEGPLYDREWRKPDWIEPLRAQEVGTKPPRDLHAAFMAIVGSPNIASKRWAWEQYDRQVQLGTVVGPGNDAAVLRLPGARTRLAVSTDGNGRWCYLDPYWGAQHAVAEAARNVTAVGAEPSAVTNCLNFGSPERAEVMWQFREVVRGLGDACRALRTPVVGGNVSFYNETGSQAIYPTPIVGMVGLLPEEVTPPPLGFQQEGDLVAVVGETYSELGGSEYLRTIEGLVAGRLPLIDLERERAAQAFVRAAVARGLLASVHDVSEGGLAVAFAEACVGGHRGARLEAPQGPAPHMWLFSESASRFLVSYSEDQASELQALAGKAGVPLLPVGSVGSSELRIDPHLRVGVHELVSVYSNAFDEAMGLSAASATLEK